MRIAAWSGPRNLSTAMMYAFAARGDCAVSDEPFFAPWLAGTGTDFPMRDTILEAHETDPAAVAGQLAGPIPGGRAHWYQKHMAHHIEPGFPLGWAEGMVHVHLIRHPARVIASYAAKRENPTLADLGYTRHLDLFARFPGPVVDSTDIRAAPAAMLERLCAEIGLPFTPAMLHWPAGGRPEDGAWAPHWYRAVHASTGFAGAEGPLPDIDSPLLAPALEVYATLARHKL